MVEFGAITSAAARLAGRRGQQWWDSRNPVIVKAERRAVAPWQVAMPRDFDLPDVYSASRYRSNELYGLLQEYGGHDVGSTIVDLNIWRRSTGPTVLVTDIRAAILSRNTTLDSLSVYFASAGSDRRTVLAFDLDSADPRAKSLDKFHLGSRSGSVTDAENFFPSKTIKVASNDVEPITVIGFAARSSCTWRIEVDIDVRGTVTTYVVGDSADMLRTTGTPASGYQNDLQYYWHLQPPAWGERHRAPH